MPPTFSPEKINEELAKYLRPPERALFGELYDQLVTGGTHPHCSILMCAARQGEGATTLALGLSTINESIYYAPLVDHIVWVFNEGVTKPAELEKALAKLPPESSAKVEIINNVMRFHGKD